MQQNPLAAHPPWRQLLIISVVLPVIIVAGVLAFAWPSARIAPRHLPVGIVGTGAAGQQAVQGLDHAQPDGFDFHLYADPAAASRAIEHREIFGAFAVTPGRITVLEAGAASPTVATLLTAAGDRLAAAASDRTGSRVTATVHDVVPLSADDPRGGVLSSVMLPLTIFGVLIAAAVALLLQFRPAWRQSLALSVISAVGAAGVYLVAQPFLGALPHEHLATGGALALTLLAVSSSVAGLLSLFGTAGLGIGSVLMVFLGNAFSGVTSAPELLPDGVHRIGQWLPTGAGANLLRSTAYFDGHGASGHLTVLVLWAIAGLAAIVVGHHRAFVIGLRSTLEDAPAPRHLTARLHDA